MIRETTGDILSAKTEAVVNPVNTVGVMGAGLALQFKLAYLGMFQQHLSACLRGEIRIGQVTVYYTGGSPEYIFNFPTKIHWRDSSKLEWIDSGLVDLRDKLLCLDIRSVAIPPLGCGLGGLQWVDVRQLIDRRLSDLPDVDVVLYVPSV